MELGEKLRQARLEAGLSQRTVCGETITRNMLSQIEHGTAKPSMGTLRYLAARLGKPVSFFLDEDVVSSPNREVMETARRRWDAGDPAGTLEALEAYRGPDEVHDREEALLLTLARLAWAEALLEAGRKPYAQEILERTDTAGLYCGKTLEHRRLLLLSRLQNVKLPGIDEELLVRAESALRTGDTARAGHLLDAAEEKSRPRWNLLRGNVCLAKQEYASAAEYFRKAEATYPEETAPCLEQCFRELGDYKQAYEYACRRAGEPRG